MEQIPTTLRERFLKIGLIDRSRAAAGKLLSEHLKDFSQSLLARGGTSKHVGQTVSRIARVFGICKFKYWSDIQADIVQKKIVSLQKQVEIVKTKQVRGKTVKTKKLKNLGQISVNTANYYFKATKQFCNWMVINKRACESPLEHLEPIKGKIDIRHARQALEPDQIRLLLETTRTQPERFGMTGSERAMLYQLAVETGLRANEIRSLTKSSFDFDNGIVTVEANNTKNKKMAVLPIRKGTAVMLKEDLAAAQIPYVDEDGKYADFHSLRHTTGSWLAACGVHPKVAQTIMRHKDINLTMSRYTHILRGQELEAINKLPDLSVPDSTVRQNPNSGKKNVLPESLPFLTGDSRTSANSDELLPTCRNKRKAPFSSQNQRFQLKNEDFLQRGRRDSN
ncbi:MAG: site-specific integrase, partial [Planctomycetes bacterium]|nr:site-specific integrase [Planctomycetota bacterium]